jgi:hypothetical protein
MVMVLETPSFENYRGARRSVVSRVTIHFKRLGRELPWQNKKRRMASRIVMEMTSFVMTG